MRAKKNDISQEDFSLVKERLSDSIYNRYRNEVYFLQGCAEEYNRDQVETDLLFLDLEKYKELLDSCNK